MHQYTPGAPSILVQSPSHDERAHPNFILPTRMGYRWRNFNHRIAVWKFGLARDHDGHPWADRLHSHSLGGPFSKGLLTQECPELKFGYQRIDVDSIERVGAARRTLGIVLNSSGVRRETKRLDRDDLQLNGYETIVPVITGFGFDTGIPQHASFPSAYAPDHGYLSRGLGAAIEVTESTEEYVEVAFWLRYGFGASLDRLHHNEALLEARVGAELDVALIGVNDVPVHTGEVSYETTHDEPKIGVEQSIDSVPKRLQRIRISGASSAPAGMFGIQAFNFDLTPERSCEWNRNWPYGDELRGDDGGHPRYGAPGYYVRELTLDLSRERYDRSTGEATFLLDGYASNATWSIPFHPLRYDFSGRMVWIQADGDHQPVRFASEFPTGACRFSLAGME